MKTRIILSAAALAVMVDPAGAEAPEACEPAYRLYRNWVPGTRLTGRAHVATFDSCVKGGAGVDYNEGNCEIARSLFQSQPGVRVTYWCELVDLH